MSELSVWRERHGATEQVGAICASSEGIRFSYDPAYSGQPISVSLPLQRESFDEAATANYFRGLIPEGAARTEFARMLHAGKEEFAPFLERLRDESIGALLFSVDNDTPYQNASYEKANDNFFEEFANRPLETAVATMGKTRLSLSGAMAKVGLYFDETKRRWYFPMGGAPSTHIVKAADGNLFPHETVNEALCLGAARRCGFPVADCSLIDAGAGEPLLAVRRFDRVFHDDEPTATGLPLPLRLHQEDFCQARSLSLKYEPTDANYLELVARVAHDHCANAFGERHMVMEYTFLHYLIGNCDNHLKNYSLLYDADWSTMEAAPLYDVANTVMYPQIYKEMGVSFGGDRRIDHVTKEAIEGAADKCGIPLAMALRAFDETADALPGALEEEADSLARQGFPAARAVFGEIIDGVRMRCAIRQA